MTAWRLCLTIWTLYFCMPVSAGRSNSVPFRFEPNVGQTSTAARFVARTKHYTAFLTADAVTLRAGVSRLQVKFVGANPNAEGVGLEPLDAHAHYLIGDSESWRTDTPAFGRLEYRNIYPGIDVAYYASGSQDLEYDLVVHPGADLSQVRIRFEGGEPIAMGGVAGVRLRDHNGEWWHGQPTLYQIRNGIRQPIAGSVMARGPDEIAFQIADYDHSLPLTIDPSIGYSTYLGGTGQDAATAVAADAIGNAYVTGWTESLDFPEAAGPRLGSPGGVDAYVAKFSPTGRLLYISYLGGNGDDRGYGIAVDGTGSAIVCGWTYSTNFPVVNAAQPRFGGVRDGFIAKLNPAGTGLIFSTYLGGNGADSANAIAVDPQGNIYAAGDTASSNFPTLNAFQKQFAGGDDAFVVKFNSTGTLAYSTYLGGAQDDRATSIAVDTSGSAFITGSTYSANFPIFSAFQTHPGGGQDAFAAKLGPTGSALIYSTYLGGSGGTAGAAEAGNGIAVDSSGCAYIAGTTSSSNFPTVSPLQASLSGSQDAFVLKLSPSGSALVYSTYLGGSSIDVATAIAVDSGGRAYVVGYTASTDFPVANAFQSSNAGGYDAFAAELNATGNALVAATYLGGSGSDSAYGIGLDANGNVHLVGQTMSPNFPIASGIQSFETTVAESFVTMLAGGKGGPPEPGGVAPNSGSGTDQIFTATYVDPQGYQDISQALFMVASNTGGVAGCFALWQPGTNALYLGNDVANAWLGPIEAGTSATLQNSQCTLNAAGSSGGGSGNTLTVRFSLTFTAGFTGTQNTYVLVYGSTGDSGWQQVGTWTPRTAQIPTNVSVAPASGGALSQTFTAIYSDATGYQDVSQALFMVASNANGVAGCFALWQPQTNALYLGNDAANAWLGPIQGSTSATLQNSQCTLSAASSSGSGSGSTLTVHFALTFASTFTGTRSTYLMVCGSAGNSGWQKAGTWTPSLAIPMNVSVTPASGSGSAQTFIATYSDTLGYQDISQALFMVASNAGGVAGCFALWQPGTNAFYLGNDAANAWLGPIQGGTSATLQNSQCTLSAATSSGSGSGNTLTVHFTLMFASTFTGTRNTYLMVSGSEGNSGWQQAGTWTPATAQVPTNVSVSPSSSNGLSQVFIAIYSDTLGYQDISQALFMVASNAGGVAGCFALWQPGTNTFHLGNDAANVWLGPIQGGTSATLQNSQCTLSAASSSGSGSGNTLTVRFT